MGTNERGDPGSTLFGFGAGPVLLACHQGQLTGVCPPVDKGSSQDVKIAGKRLQRALNLRCTSNAGRIETEKRANGRDRAILALHPISHREEGRSEKPPHTINEDLPGARHPRLNFSLKELSGLGEGPSRSKEITLEGAIRQELGQRNHRTVRSGIECRSEFRMPAVPVDEHGHLLHQGCWHAS
ncbi:hypothetical protein [Arthrobacter gyeryongensis]|uniref:hypothetical protein n=1 Tax=Arthrobacter gyeryongensis TaxID=1650592 RepID=UPI0031E52DB9